MTGVLADIWNSFRVLPGWVQFWVAIILVPVNCASVLFLGQVSGLAVLVLALGGMMPNLVLMIAERGFSRAMSFSHLIFWIPLIFLVIWLITGKANISAGFRAYLYVLLVVDLISLMFDFSDSWKWLHGDRKVAGK